MAPAAAVQLAQDLVAVQLASGVQLRRERKGRRLPGQLVDGVGRQLIDTQDLDAQIVVAAVT